MNECNDTQVFSVTDINEQMDKNAQNDLIIKKTQVTCDSGICAIACTYNKDHKKIENLQFFGCDQSKSRIFGSTSLIATDTDNKTLEPNSFALSGDICIFYTHESKPNHQPSEEDAKLFLRGIKIGNNIIGDKDVDSSISNNEVSVKEFKLSHQTDVHVKTVGTQLYYYYLHGFIVHEYVTLDQIIMGIKCLEPLMISIPILNSKQTKEFPVSTESIGSTPASEIKCIPNIAMTMLNHTKPIDNVQNDEIHHCQEHTHQQDGISQNIWNPSIMDDEHVKQANLKDASTTVMETTTTRTTVPVLADGGAYDVPQEPVFYYDSSYALYMKLIFMTVFVIISLFVAYYVFFRLQYRLPHKNRTKQRSSFHSIGISEHC